MAIPELNSYEMPRPEIFPRNKAPWTLIPDRAVLLVHDMQRYFVDFYPEGCTLVADLTGNAASLKDACRRLGIPVIYTAQPVNQAPEDRGLLNDMWGRGIDNKPELKDIVPALAPGPGDRVLTKWRYSAFQRSDLQEIMTRSGRDQLLICGVYGHIGCLMTAANAFMLDIKPFIVGDAIADFTLEDHLYTLKYTATRCGNVTSVREVTAL